LRWRAVRVRHLGNPHRPYLEERLLGDRVPFGYGQLVRRPRVPVGGVAAGPVEVPVVERREDDPLPYAADAGPRLDGAPRRLDADHVALLDAEALGVEEWISTQASGAAFWSCGARAVFVRVWKW
jgi:hypothetical protein